MVAMLRPASFASCVVISPSPSDHSIIVLQWLLTFTLMPLIFVMDLERNLFLTRESNLAAFFTVFFFIK